MQGGSWDLQLTIVEAFLRNDQSVVIKNTGRDALSLFETIAADTMALRDNVPLLTGALI